MSTYTFDLCHTLTSAMLATTRLLGYGGDRRHHNCSARYFLLIAALVVWLPLQAAEPLPELPAGLSPELQACIAELAEGRDRAWEQWQANDVYKPKRHDAAVKLAKLGPAAVPAVPFLIYYIDQDSFTRVDKVENRQGATLYDYITKRDQRFDVTVVRSQTQYHYVLIQDALIKMGKAATPELVKVLRDPQAAEKRLLRCLPVLEELQDHEALPDLLTVARQSKNPKIQAAALYAVGTWAEEATVTAQLKEALGSPNVDLQRAAAAGLARVKAWDPALADFWRRAWGGADLALACYGVEAAAHLPAVPDDLLEPLIQSLALIGVDNPETQETLETVRKLVKGSQSAAVPFLIKAAVADSDRLRGHAVKLLAESGDARGIDVLRRRACLEPLHDVAVTAALGLVDHGVEPFLRGQCDPFVPPADRMMEQSHSSQPRPYTYDAIKALCTEEDVRVLLQTVGYSILNQEALGRRGEPMIASPGAMVAAREVLGNSAVAGSAATTTGGRHSPCICIEPALSILDALGEKTDPWLAAALASPDPVTRSGALLAVRDGSPVRRVPPAAHDALLMVARTDPSWSNRRYALNGLQKLRAPELPAVIAELLSDKDPAIYGCALEALRVTPTSAAIHPLVELLRAVGPQTGDGISAALMRLGDAYPKELQAEMAVALEKHADPAVRRGVAKCLANTSRCPETEKALLHAFAADQDPEVRGCASEALLKAPGDACDAAAVVAAVAAQLTAEPDVNVRRRVWRDLVNTTSLKADALRGCHALQDVVERTAPRTALTHLELTVALLNPEAQAAWTLRGRYFPPPTPTPQAAPHAGK